MICLYIVEAKRYQGTIRVRDVGCRDGRASLDDGRSTLVDPERALELKDEDPAVKAGKYRVEAFQWLLPAGLVHFTAGHLPRSMAEAQRG